MLSVPGHTACRGSPAALSGLAGLLRAAVTAMLEDSAEGVTTKRGNAVFSAPDVLDVLEALLGEGLSQPAPTSSCNESWRPMVEVLLGWAPAAVSHSLVVLKRVADGRSAAARKQALELVEAAARGRFCDIHIGSLHFMGPPAILRVPGRVWLIERHALSFKLWFDLMSVS